MRHDFSAIPESPRARDGAGSLLQRIYHDVGLAAVAAALGLVASELEPDVEEAVERGAFYLVPPARALAS